MSKIFTLVKTILKNSSAVKDTFKKKLVIFVLGLLFLFYAGFIIFSLSLNFKLMIDYNLEAYYWSLLLQNVLLFILVINLNYIISTLFLANDLEYFFTLPLTPIEIMTSKFLVVLIYNLYFTLPLSLLFGISYTIAAGFNLLFWIALLIIGLLLPVLPMVLMSVIIFISSIFIPFFKNKERVTVFTSIISIVFIIPIILLMTEHLIPSDESFNLAEIILNNQQPLLTNVFSLPTLSLMVNFLLDFKILDGFIFIALSLGSLMLLIYLSSLFYFKLILNFNTSASSKKKSETSDYKRFLSKKGHIPVFIKREILILLKTPAYFINNLVSSILVPILIIIALVFYFINPEVKEAFDQLVLSINSLSLSSLFLGAFAIGLLTSSINLITATAISREGKVLAFIKTLPVSFSTFTLAKIYTGVLISFFLLLPFILLTIIVLKIKLILSLIIVLAFIISFFVVAYLGIITDLFYPKLIWDNEYVPVKNNFFSVVSLLFIMFLSFVSVLFAFILYNTNNYLVWLCLFALTCFVIVLHFSVKNIAQKQLKTLEI